MLEDKMPSSRRLAPRRSMAPDTAFAAYYALSLIYKKNSASDSLRALTDDSYRIFGSYPLYFEVNARYYKRVGDFARALTEDKMAINLLRSRGVENLAVCISDASRLRK